MTIWGLVLAFINCEKRVKTRNMVYKNIEHPGPFVAMDHEEWTWINVVSRFNWLGYMKKIL